MSVDVLIVVSTPSAGQYVKPLLGALHRASCTVAVFLTNDGVALASHNQLADELATVSQTVVCADSWSRYFPDDACPLTLGSQTDNSQLAGVANKIISF